MTGLVFCAAFWALTGRLEAYLFTGFGGLIVAGQGAEAVRSLKGPPSPPPIPDSTIGEPDP